VRFPILLLAHVARPYSSDESHITFCLSFGIGQVLKENRKQGEEDQAFEKHVEGKKAAAKKRATRRSARFFSFLIGVII
jgi:hypothetical protein